MGNPALRAMQMMDDLAEDANRDSLKFVVFTPASLSVWIGEKGTVVWKDGAGGKRIKWQEARRRITQYLKDLDAAPSA